MDWSEDPRCPYCAHPIAYPADIEFTVSDYAEETCEECGKLFSVHRYVTVDYATSKPRLET